MVRCRLAMLLLVGGCIFQPDLSRDDLQACPDGEGCPKAHVCTHGVCVFEGGEAPDPSCGDGLVDSGEACDDGNSVDTDACLTTCESARCGDGVTRADTEACDDGNAVETDACLSTCIVARCGDGLRREDVEVGHPDFEHCDDGNAIEDDGCTSDCRPSLLTFRREVKTLNTEAPASFALAQATGQGGAADILTEAGLLLVDPGATELFGTVPPPGDYGSASRPLFVDMDGTGRPEVVRGQRTHPFALDVLRFRADSDSLEFVGNGYTPENPSVGAFSEFMASDLDGDGDQDLLGVVPNLGAMVLLSESFTEAGPGFTRQDLQCPTLPQAVLLELNGDGAPDVALVCSGRTVKTFLNDGRGHFTEGSRLELPPQYGFYDLVALDRGEEATDDLVLAIRSSHLHTFEGQLVLLENDGGPFNPQILADDVVGIVTLLAADLDGDSRQELIVGHQTSGDSNVINSLRFWWRTDDGGLRIQEEEVLLRSKQVGAADLNGDGATDLVSLDGAELTLLIQDSEGDAYGVPRDCQSFHALNPNHRGFTYLRVDPDQEGPFAPVNVKCDLSTEVSGWTQAIRLSGGDVLWDAWSEARDLDQAQRPNGGTFGLPLSVFSDQADGTDLEFNFKINGVYAGFLYSAVPRQAWQPAFPEGETFGAGFDYRCRGCTVLDRQHCEANLVHANALWNWAIAADRPDGCGGYGTADAFSDALVISGREGAAAEQAVLVYGLDRYFETEINTIEVWVRRRPAE